VSRAWCSFPGDILTTCWCHDLQTAIDAVATMPWVMTAAKDDDDQSKKKDPQKLEHVLLEKEQLLNDQPFDCEICRRQLCRERRASVIVGHPRPPEGRPGRGDMIEGFVGLPGSTLYFINELQLELKLLEWNN